MDFEDRCLIKYNITYDMIISSKVITSHDGYDEYGPESNLYDYYVLFNNNNKIYFVNFHREYWFRGKDDDEYFLYQDNIFNRCISDELIQKGYFILNTNNNNTNNSINQNESINNDEYIYYTSNMLSLMNNQNYHKIMDLNSNISLYINKLF